MVTKARTARNKTGRTPSGEQRSRRLASQASKRHRAVQKQVERADKRHPEKKAKSGIQTGARRYPSPPMPKKHLKKPGREADLTLAPMYDAPFYKGSDKLKDKVAVITGGDSGIGRAVAVLFAREGANVAIIYLDEHDDAEETCRAVRDEGAQCMLIPGDVADRAFCFEAVEKILDEFGGIDVLVNNAAFQEHIARFEDLTEEHFDLTLKTNLYGYFHMAQAVVPHMAKGAAIVNSGSVTGLNGSGHLVDYATTKGGIHAFTRSLASNLLPRGIRVNAVAPGPVWTPLNPADKLPKDIKKFGAHSDMKRPAQPEEIAPAYVFLASEQCSSYITGEILPIIGGYGG
jgi:NAD(P)-dependent dehydrogenase (short-subunit alcohol dehydrogenase family)